MSTVAPLLNDVLLRRKDVLEVMGFGNTYLYKMIAKGKFPPPLKLPGTRSVAWRKSDLEKWMSELQPKS